MHCISAPMVAPDIPVCSKLRSMHRYLKLCPTTWRWAGAAGAQSEEAAPAGSGHGEGAGRRPRSAPPRRPVGPDRQRQELRRRRPGGLQPRARGPCRRFLPPEETPSGAAVEDEYLSWTPHRAHPEGHPPPHRSLPVWLAHGSMMMMVNDDGGDRLDDPAGRGDHSPATRMRLLLKKDSNQGRLHAAGGGAIRGCLHKPAPARRGHRHWPPQGVRQATRGRGPTSRRRSRSGHRETSLIWTADSRLRGEPEAALAEAIADAQAGFTEITTASP